jgi:small-conductance mechanosensitive channel
MNSEIQLVWHEALSEFSTLVALWQFAVIVIAGAIAWAINGALLTYFSNSAPESWRLGIDSFNRVIFPLLVLIFVQIGKLLLAHWQHTSFLHLASTLLFAMVLIRLAVYALRYIIAPSGLLKTLENSLSSTIWTLLVLHLSGLLPQLFDVLGEVKFKIGKYPVDLLLVLQAILTIVITIFIALWISRFVENKVMRTEQLNVNVRVVLTKLLRILLLFIAVMIALSAVGLDITFLSVFGGALGVGLGFGLQRIASNYVSGFIILLDKSMQIGDVITVDKHYGVISDLRSRYMVLAKNDGAHVIIPNEALITTSVVNHSLVEHKGIVQINLCITYESDLDLAIKLIWEAIKNNERVLNHPAADVFVKGFTEYGIDLALSAWINNPEIGKLAFQSKLQLAIWHAFKVNNIAFGKLQPAKEV